MTPHWLLFLLWEIQRLTFFRRYKHTSQTFPIGLSHCSTKDSNSTTSTLSFWHYFGQGINSSYLFTHWLKQTRGALDLLKFGGNILLTYNFTKSVMLLLTNQQSLWSIQTAMQQAIPFSALWSSSYTGISNPFLSLDHPWWPWLYGLPAGLLLQLHTIQ